MKKVFRHSLTSLVLTTVALSMSQAAAPAAAPAVAIALAAPTSPSAAASASKLVEPEAISATIKIGVILPLTGPSSDMGKSALFGAQMAIDEANEYMGIYMRKKFELAVRDDVATPAVGLLQAEDLVLKEKVSATVGFCNTGVAMKALDVFQNNKQPLIVSCATGSAITQKFPAVSSYIFSVAANDKLQTQFLVDSLIKRNLKNPGLLFDTSGYGEAGLKDFLAALEKSNIKPRLIVRFNVGVTSLSAEIKQLKDSGADSLIGWSVGPEQGVISASRKAAGWVVPQFGSWGLANASAFVSSGGAVDETMMVQTVMPNPRLERNASFLRRYKKISKEQLMGSMMSASQTYDAVNLIVRSMFQAQGDFSGPSLKKNLESLQKPYPGIVTTYVKPFSTTDHDAISANMLWLGAWKDGERVFASKEDAQLAISSQRKQ